ncbi:MAG: LPS-assembly protein LptD [gamma proteobacterium symbiont of Taylorina sp.]|nr:LPS-assembly protein LptD [gamma proteobacterium symbiont of Taylorina sp.]
MTTLTINKNLISQFNTPLLAIFLFFNIAGNAGAETFSPPAWQCQPIANEKWNCAVSDRKNTPVSSVDGSIKIVPAELPSVSEPEPSSQNTIIPSPVIKEEPAAAKPSSVNTVTTTMQTTNSHSSTINTTGSNCAPQVENQHLGQSPFSQNDETNIEADHAITPDRSQIHFTGNVIVTQNSQQLVSDIVDYNKITGVFDAQGNVVITKPGLILQGDMASYQTDERSGKIDNTHYQLPARPAQGVASSIHFKPGEVNLENVTYSTCPAGDQDWVISADKMELYTEEGYGEGSHATIRFKDVPVFYTPYIRFPLNDERQSGFLMPHVGTSDNNGFELATPYYFNIAPDQDATITPQLFSKRGLMLGGEYRYLSERHSGEIYAEWLNDSIYDDKRDASEVSLREGGVAPDDITDNNKITPQDISKNRGAFSLQQRTSWANGWRGNIDYNYVSDNYYLEDFANNLRDKSESHLLREGRLNYNGSFFNFMARLQGYQELQHSSHTYSRLPQLTLSAHEVYSVSGFDINAGLESEFVMFAQNWQDSQDQRVESSRLFLKPYLSVPYRNSYSFIIPKLSLDMATYQLDNEDTDPNRSDNWDNDSPNRIAPIFSLDSGLFFDKELSLFDSPLKQTLEPRLFYLNVPAKDQDDIPLFDTSIATFSFNQLFRENRFTGVDRLGDANQLTAAVTTRFIDDKSGAERFKASIGQIYYFNDREVTLRYDSKGNPIQSSNDTESSSSIAAELTSQFTQNWYTGYSILYDPHNNGSTEQSRYRLQYKSDAYHIANFDYSYRNDAYDSKDGYEQLELSTYWAIAPQWRALAHWYYSLYDASASINPDDERDAYTLESKVGIEYDSCCYAVRLVLGREQSDYYSDADNSIMLQFQFKGLGSIAQRTGSLSSASLADDIPGFEPWEN